jgi:hypothetical protein
MAARLYADENFDFAVVQYLRNAGHDVLTAQEAGQAQKGIPDAGVLAHAVGLDRAVLTHNRRHFIGLHFRVRQHSGIIVCTRDPDTSAVGQRIETALNSVPDLHGQLLRVNLPSKP